MRKTSAAISVTVVGIATPPGAMFLIFVAA
jgi:hypothetical protein